MPVYKGLLGLLQPRPPVSKRLVFMAIAAKIWKRYGVVWHRALIVIDFTNEAEMIYFGDVRRHCKQNCIPKERS